ncbi:putative RFA1 protein [Hyaloraphidium curvatum]|nr:putative RFA1 protein [Hyaloraphidium curvatum]
MDLSTGAVALMYNSALEARTPTLQVLNIKKIQPQPGQQQTQERYRLIISDGQHYIQAMVATQLNEKLTSGLLQKNGIIQVHNCVTNQVQGRKIVIILGMDVLTPNNGTMEKIGAPANIEPNAGNEAGGPQNAAAPQHQAPPSVSHAPPMNSYGGGHAALPPQNNYGGGQPAPPQNRPPQYGAQGGSSYGGGGGGGFGNNQSNVARPGSDAHGAITPIASLNPYQQRFTICARASNKSDIKTWSNQRGEGKLFSVTFLDDSGEIRATAFNDQCTRFFDLVEDGGVYFVSKADIRVAKGGFGSNNQYELQLRHDTTIEKCNDSSVGVPTIRYNFVPIASIGEYEKDAQIDVIGVVKDCGEVQQIISKSTQRAIDKRDITIVDDSNQSIRLTLWGKQAMNFRGDNNPVIAVKSAKVGDFGGRSLSLYSTSTLTMDPDIPETHRLSSWFNGGGRTAEFHSFAGTMGGGGGAGGRKDVFKTVAQVKDENLGHGDKPDYFNLNATIVFIRNENVAYPACPTETCNKKLNEEGPNNWRCEKCQKFFEAPNWRYIMSCSVSDHTGQMWLSAFNETAQAILGGMSANDLIALRDSDSNRYGEIFTDATFKRYNFRVRAKMENFNEEQKIKCSIMAASPVDWSEMSNQLIETINQYGQ